MDHREVLAKAVARDPRYTIEAYEFVFAALDRAKVLKRKARRAAGRGRRTKPGGAVTRHVSGRDLCEAARDLALDLYGRLALSVLGGWGLRSTSDIGEVVYNLIATGDLERSPTDRRDDFDDAFEFEAAFEQGYTIPLDGLDED